MTQEQKQNLLKLARYLWKRKPGKWFNMKFLTNDKRGCDFELSDAEPFVDCGTVGCALGWAPAAGVATKNGEGWERFAVRAFDLPFFSRSWAFLFDMNWDSNPRLAAARIVHLLLQGEPSYEDRLKQPRIPTSADWKRVEELCA